ncbi:MAG TPA: isoprenylcysteine carboxylmethyltransferase family protein [Opitutaceae bacterium]
MNTNDTPSLSKRIAVLAYGVASYAAFFGTYLYAAGFIGNILVPKSMDSGATDPFWFALLVNAGLLTLFAVQHSVMARQPFKRLLTRFIPQAAERSTYTLASSLALILLFWQWRPMGGVIWNIESTAGSALMYAGFAFGFLLVLVTTFLINHFDLFGLRQVWKFFRNLPYRQLKFVTPGPYKLVRHPLYVGWLFAFWCTPTMTVAHLVFAIATTAYILVAIQLEERDLVDVHGRDYIEYRKRTPMLIPGKPLGAGPSNRETANAEA